MLTVLIAVLAMGLVFAWNLRAGFTDYLRARDEERLTDFAAFVAAELTNLPKDEWRSIDLRRLLDSYGRRQVGPVIGAHRDDLEPLPGPPGPDELPPPSRRARPPWLEGPPGSPPPPPPRDREDVEGTDARSPGSAGTGRIPPDEPGSPGIAARRPRTLALPSGAPSPDAFGRRLALLDADHRPWMGQWTAASAPQALEAPIVVRGETFGYLRLLPAPPASDALDRRFLEHQYQSIGVVAGVLLLLSVVAGTWFARRWVRPLSELQQATGRIARGDFAVRLPETRNDEIGTLVRNVNQMVTGLETLESGRRRWIANMAHELRTPLAVLRAETDALIDGVRPLGASALASLREEIERLGQLVEDLHLLALSDLDALPCHFSDCDAGEIVGRTLERHRARAEARGLALVGPQIPTAMAVCWDRSRIEQVLDNLLENSLRYTDPPGTIKVSIDARGTGITLRVDDSAPGVPANALPRLFEPLFRVDPARSRVQGGSGLGLALCAAIVRAHGGRIAAQGSPLGGLAVVIELPRTPPAAS